MATLLRFAALVMAPAYAIADVTYYSYKSVRNWNIPGGDTTVVFTFTALFGASVWFVARAIWLRERTAQKRNLLFAVATFVPAIALVLMHAQRS